MAHQHVWAYQKIPDVQLVAAVDVVPERLQAFAEKHAVSQTFTSVEEAIGWGDWETDSAWTWKLSTAHGSRGALGDAGVHTGGSIGTITATRAATGHLNDMVIKVYGETGALDLRYRLGKSELHACLGAAKRIARQVGTGRLPASEVSE